MDLSRRLMLGDLLASAHSADCPEFLTACGRAMLLNKFTDNPCPLTANSACHGCSINLSGVNAWMRLSLGSLEGCVRVASLAFQSKHESECQGCRTPLLEPFTVDTH